MNPIDSSISTTQYSSALPSAPKTSAAQTSVITERFLEGLSRRAPSMTFGAKLYESDRISEQISHMDSQSPVVKKWKEMSENFLEPELSVCKSIEMDPGKFKEVSREEQSFYGDFIIYKKRWDLFYKLDAKDASSVRTHCMSSVSNAKSWSFYNPEHAVLVESLIDSRVLFTLFYSSELSTNSYINIISQSKYSYLLNDLPPFIRDNLADIESLAKMNSRSTEENMINFTKHQQQIEQSISHFLQNEPLLGQAFKASFANELSRLEHYRSGIEQYRNGTRETLTENEFPLLETYCILHELYDVQSHIFNKEAFSASTSSFQQKMFFHLFLDKASDNDQFTLKSFYIRCAAGGLLRALEQMRRELPSMHPSLTHSVSQFYMQFKPLLEDVIKYDVRDLLGDYRAIVIERLWKKIESLEPGEKVLVPAGMKTHAVSILLEKNTDNTFNLTLYNTGAGLIDHHPRWLETRRFQTHLVIDQVPATSILNKETWVKLIDAKSKETSMEAVYGIFYELGTDGIKASPSQNEEDYELIQRSGTCAMQNLMGCMRHLIMKSLATTPPEKEAVYKYIKLALQGGWLRSFSVTSALDKWLPQITSKLGAERQLCDLALDPQVCEKALTECQVLLRQNGHILSADQIGFRDDINQFQRYSLLRKAANILNVHLVGEISFLPDSLLENPVMNLAGTKWISQQKIFNNLVHLMDQSESFDNLEDWVRYCCILLIDSNPQQKGIDEVTRRLAKEDFAFDIQEAKRSLEKALRKTYPKTTDDLMAKINKT